MHSFLAVDTLNLSTRFTLTGFVGPQYSENQGLLRGRTVHASSDWSLAGGAEGGWRDERTSVSAGYSRNISDGGGILGAVRLQNIYGNLRREFVPGWTVARYRQSRQQSGDPVALANQREFHYSNFGWRLAGAERGKSVGFRMGYAHDLEQESGWLPQPRRSMRTGTEFLSRFVSVGQTSGNVVIEAWKKNCKNHSEPIDFNEIKGIVRRRRWQFLVPFFCGWLLVWGASWLIRPTYRSGTLILVEQPSVPEKYVVSNIDSDIQHQLDSITEQILSRTRLLRIIDHSRPLCARTQTYERGRSGGENAQGHRDRTDA